MKSIQEIAAHFQGVKWKAGGAGFKALCPCHSDKNPSLDVDLKDGKLLLICRAKCDTANILSAVGLSWSDILPDRSEKRLFRDWYKLDRKYPVSAIYDYQDANGKYLYSNIRFSLPNGGKDFRQYILKPDQTGVEKYSASGRKSLFNLPAMIEAVKRGETVFVVEGEKDVLKLKEDDLVATTSGGANTWTESFSEYFRDANVVLLPDNDAAGESYADTVQREIIGVVKSLKRITISELPKGDVTDYLTKENGTKEKLLQMVAGAPDLKELESSSNDKSVSSSAPGAETGNLERFHLHNKNGTASGAYDWAIYKYLSETENLFVLGGTIYYYDAGVFRADTSGSQLSTMIRNLIYPQFRRAPTVRRIFDLFVKSAELQVRTDDLNMFPAYWICFQNGFYDPLQHRIIPHDPRYRTINMIPHSYDPDSAPQGQHVKKWLEGIAEPDDLEMLLQFAGYCMTRDTRQQKFLILRGSGGTGKSTLIRLIEAVVGTENISNVSLSQLSQRFAAFGLMGKLVNSCADLETTALEDTSIIKKVLGEDRISAEAKGKDAVSFRNYSKLIFSTNELPIVKAEKTNGFYRRLLVLTMNRIPEHHDPDLFSVLVSEIDTFIHMAVDALERMLRAGYIHESQGSIEGVKQLRRDSDTVQAFLESCCTLNPKGTEKKSDLFAAYRNFCQESERQALTRNSFYKSMRLKCFTEVKTDLGIMKGIMCYRGISLGKTAGKLPGETQETAGNGFVPADDQDIPF